MDLKARHVLFLASLRGGPQSTESRGKEGCMSIVRKRSCAGDMKVRKALEALHSNRVLTWYPWIGSEYTRGGLLVVGESNYANGDVGHTPDAARKAVDGNVYFTECVVSRFCINRSERNPTFDGITNVLCDDLKKDILSAGRHTWGRIAYMDVIQQSMRGKGKDWKTGEGRSRPTKGMWGPGWNAVLEVMEILKPGSLLFVGAGVANHFSSKYMQDGYSAEMKAYGKIGRHIWRKGALVLPSGQKIKVCVVPNPGGAHGFSPKEWRAKVRRFLGL